MKLLFRSHKTHRQRYKALLTEDWSEQTLVETRDFLIEQLAAAGLRIIFRPEEEERDEEPKLYPIPPSASEELRDHLESLNYNLRLAYERRREQREWLESQAQKRLHTLVQSIAFLLVFPVWPNPERPRFTIEGDMGLFDDTRSILYLCTAYDLLPQLIAKKREDLSNLLIHAMYTHASIIWNDKNSAHQHYLFSVLFDCIGDHERSAQALFQSFQSTESSDHDYFTRAYNYWSYQMDRKEVDEATRFALRIHREVPVELVAPAEELIAESFRRRG